MATVSELLSNAKNAFVGKETSVTKLKAIFALLAMGFEYDTLEDLSGRLGVRPIELKKLIRVIEFSRPSINANHEWRYLFCSRVHAAKVST